MLVVRTGFAAKRLGVKLIDESKPAEFSLVAVVVAVVVLVASKQAGPADLVDDLLTLHDSDMRRQLGDPAPPGALIPEVVLARRRVLEPGEPPHAVVDAEQQPGRYAVGQLQVVDRLLGMIDQRCGPDKAGRPITEKIKHRGR